MADPTSDKPGFFSRLFGRFAEQPLEEPKPEVPAGPEATVPPVDPTPSPTPSTEDAPDFQVVSRKSLEMQREYGWPIPFYAFGAVGFLWAVAWVVGVGNGRGVDAEPVPNDRRSIPWRMTFWVGRRSSQYCPFLCASVKIATV